MFVGGRGAGMGASNLASVQARQGKAVEATTPHWLVFFFFFFR